MAVKNDVDSCQYFLLKDYQTFDEIIEKEVESFLFSCWNNEYDKIN